MSKTQNASAKEKPVVAEPTITIRGQVFPLRFTLRTVAALEEQGFPTEAIDAEVARWSNRGTVAGKINPVALSKLILAALHGITPFSPHEILEAIEWREIGRVASSVITAINIATGSVKCAPAPTAPEIPAAPAERVQ